MISIFSLKVRKAMPASKHKSITSSLEGSTPQSSTPPIAPDQGGICSVSASAGCERRAGLGLNKSARGKELEQCIGASWGNVCAVSVHMKLLRNAGEVESKTTSRDIGLLSEGNSKRDSGRSKRRVTEGNMYKHPRNPGCAHGEIGTIVSNPGVPGNDDTPHPPHLIPATTPEYPSCALDGKCLPVSNKQ